MDSQIRKYKRRFWLSASLGLLLIFVVGVVGFYVLMPEERVSLPNLNKLHIGMRKTEVKALLGSSLQQKDLKGEMMSWITRSNLPGRTFQPSWCEPGGLVYSTDYLNDREFTGPQVENWGSSKLFIIVQFDDHERIVRYSGFPAHLNTDYGTWWQQVTKTIQYWWDHRKI
jgi:hypothetical protein